MAEPGEGVGPAPRHDGHSVAASEAERDDRDGGHGGSAAKVAALAVLEDNWREEGFTAPNRRTYPWQWLWDSCFHAVVWSALGRPDRAQRELESLFASQLPGGFVPHMRYVGGPRVGESFWGRPETSSITQPPMYGHALASLIRGGHDPGSLVDAAKSAIMSLLRRRRTPTGLVPIFHPWESGCDDSARWDDGGHDAGRWWTEKGRLVETLRFDGSGAPVANDAFNVGSIGFNALVVFNARELESIGVEELSGPADDLCAALDRRRSAHHRTWIDDSDRSGRAARTLDAHLVVLTGIPGTGEAFADLVDTSQGFGALFGPAGAARDEPTRQDAVYWRGPAWPQLSYLCWLAARRAGRPETRALAASLREAMTVSGFAEYWNPDTGEGLGAAPQSWTTLGAIV